MFESFDPRSPRLRGLAAQWQEEGRSYVRAIRSFIEKGEKEGWDTVGSEPVDGRSALASDLLNVIRAANQAGAVEELRRLFPPATAPFGALLEEKARWVGHVVLLPDGRILARVGALLPAEKGHVFLVDAHEAVPLEDVLAVGRSGDHAYLAVASRDGVEIRRRFEAPPVVRMGWPTGQEGAWARLNLAPIKVPRRIEQLIPFPDGERVLLACADGIFVMTAKGSMRIHPEIERHEKHLAWHRSEYPDEPVPDVVDLSMAHGAVSPDGSLVAVGDQDSRHRILDGNLRQIVALDPASEYPHYAVFSADGRQLACNSCHLYNGDTFGIPISELRDPGTGRRKRVKGTIEFEWGGRVYAAAVRRQEYILGDAHGYILGVDHSGKRSWDFHLGGTISGMDVSADGSLLAVGSYAGVLHLIDLDVAKDVSLNLGSGPHRERWRWLFWKGEDRPWRW